MWKNMKQIRGFWNIVGGQKLKFKGNSQWLYSEVDVKTKA